MGKDGQKRNRNRKEAHKGWRVAQKRLISRIFDALKAPAKALKGYKKKDFGGLAGSEFEPDHADFEGLEQCPSETEPRNIVA